MTLHPRIRSVAVDTPYIVRLAFADGSDGPVDLAPWIVGANGIFAELQDPAYFRRVAVDDEAGTIIWPNGADLDPDVLYEVAHATVGAPAPQANGR